MSAEEECNCKPCKPGLPAWLATFGDLMSLLMCFFVLLLSFSEMDVLRFKQLAGSMREAFGVQAQIKVEDIPKGTSIIAQEFSPGRPEPTPLNEVRQMTTAVELHTWMCVHRRVRPWCMIASLQWIKSSKKPRKNKRDRMPFSSLWH
ncbi:flagellar motor protein MotB [Nitrincola sp. A-D6]|uniref:flagellar motor protein MotB n=1 Tax=Nitrincola sp. A-D6 TaxID=1545442 RepID=UPI000A78FCAF|nr:flagellar motor protein MotB [Nitrincola sp. A-D6]